eukprot:scaffold194_cov25-Attheya_sp.AAC.1
MAVVVVVQRIIQANKSHSCGRTEEHVPKKRKSSSIIIDGSTAVIRSLSVPSWGDWKRTRRRRRQIQQRHLR